MSPKLNIHKENKGIKGFNKLGLKHANIYEFNCKRSPTNAMPTTDCRRTISTVFPWTIVVFDQTQMEPRYVKCKLDLFFILSSTLLSMDKHKSCITS